MKRNLLNFTRGSQLLGHFGFMFAAGLKGPVIIAAVVIGGLCWWNLSKGLSPHETYLIWMRIYAAIYGFMEFDPAKSIAIETGLGGTVQMPLGVVEDYPPIILAWAHMLALLKQALIRSALALVPAMIAFYWFAARFGSRSKERKHERGALLATLPELTAEIGEHNAREWKRELNEAMGIKWRFALGSELRRLFPYAPSHLAKVSYPWRLEQSHAMLIGTTGMGKTVALSDMIEEARSTGQRAVIFDLTGTFIEHFYESDRDIILNPLDARCPQWSVFDECRDEAEFSAAAEALVPHDGGGSEQFWVLAARLLFVEMCLKLRAKGSDTNEALATELMTADLTQVHKLMRGTIADPLTAPEAARMAESIRAVFNANAKALKLLPKTGPRFSVRDWVESDARDGSMLYISARYIDMSVCSQLLTVWLDTGMNTLMAMERTRDLRLWFFIDELGALHRLPALEKGLQTARNFGGAIVTGIHAYAKLKEVYGENMAMTLSSLARTKLILGTADRETATWCSDFIGHTQVRDMEEGYTYGYNNARDAVSLTPRKNIEPLLLPDQLMNLPRLSGYLKFPDGFPAAPVKLIPVSRKKRAEPFIRRAGENGPSSGTHSGQLVDPATQSNADEHPSANDDGAGKRVVPSQGELPLTPANIFPGNERAMPSDQPRIIEGDAGAKLQPGPDPAPNDNRDKPIEPPRENRSGTTLPALPMDTALRAGAPQTEGQEQWSLQGALPAPRPALSTEKTETDRDMGKADAARRLMLEDGMREKGEAKDVVDLGDLDMDL